MKQIFAFYDKKAEVLLDFWSSHNLQTAMRDAQIQMEKNDHLRTYADDFTLTLLGTFDPLSGIEGQPMEAVIELSSLRVTNE